MKVKKKSTKTTVKTPNKKATSAGVSVSTSVSTKGTEASCSKCFDAVSCILNTPYNWSIGLFTLIIWALTSFVDYYSTGNFDMLLALHDYIQLLSLVAIIVGLMRADNKQYMLLTKYGISAYFLSILTIIFTRNALVATNILAHFLLKPASIFFFLMIIKQVWNVAACKK
jgi:hypothetical protein